MQATVRAWRRARASRRKMPRPGYLHHFKQRELVDRPCKHTGISAAHPRYVLCWASSPCRAASGTSYCTGMKMPRSPRALEWTESSCSLIASPAPPQPCSRTSKRRSWTFVRTTSSRCEPRAPEASGTSGPPVRRSRCAGWPSASRPKLAVRRSREGRRRLPGQSCGQVPWSRPHSAARRCRRQLPAAAAPPSPMCSRRAAIFGCRR
jgi:hypothetical protein